MRPTALIRHLLELELMQQHLTGQIRLLKQTLRDNDISIIMRNETALDIHLQYRLHGRFYEATYLRPMLDAVVKGKLKMLRGDENSS